MIHPWLGDAWLFTSLVHSVRHGLSDRNTPWFPTLRDERFELASRPSALLHLGSWERVLGAYLMGGPIQAPPDEGNEAGDVAELLGELNRPWSAPGRDESADEEMLGFLERTLLPAGSPLKRFLDGQRISYQRHGRIPAREPYSALWGLMVHLVYSQSQDALLCCGPVRNEVLSIALRRTSKLESATIVLPPFLGALFAESAELAELPRVAPEARDYWRWVPLVEEWLELWKSQHAWSDTSRKRRRELAEVLRKEFGQGHLQLQLHRPAEPPTSHEDIGLRLACFQSDWARLPSGTLQAFLSLCDEQSSVLGRRLLTELDQLHARAASTP